MALEVRTAPEWEDEVREGPAADPEETAYDLDLCEELIPNTPLENADDAQVIADALKSGTATDPAVRRNFLKLQWRMEEILWTSIIMDMCSEAIVKSSTAHNGPADGAKRTKETRDYFGSFLMRTPLREQMERITDYVNNLHADVGVRDETGVVPRITDEYLAPFVFVLAAIAEETRRFFREEMRLPEGTDMKKIDEAIFNIWYRGAGYAAGLQSVPADMEAHERLYETYKKRSERRMWQRPKARDQACVTARAFIPHLSAVAHCSEQEFTDRLLKTHPELHAILRLEDPRVPEDKLETVKRNRPRIGEKMQQLNDTHADGRWKKKEREPDLLLSAGQLGIRALLTAGKNAVRSLLGKDTAERQYRTMIDALWAGVKPAETPALPIPFGTIKELAAFAAKEIAGLVLPASLSSYFAGSGATASPVSGEADENSKQEPTPHAPVKQDPFSRTLFHILNNDPALAMKLKLHLETRTLTEGDTLTHFGEDPGSLLVIAVDEGELGVFVPDDRDYDREIPDAAYRADGRFSPIGEITMVRKVVQGRENASAMATVRAKEKTTVRYISIAPAQFEELLDADPRYAQRIKRSLLPAIQARLKKSAEKPSMQEAVPALREPVDAADAQRISLLLQQTLPGVDDAPLQHMIATMIDDLQLYGKLSTENGHTHETNAEAETRSH